MTTITFEKELKINKVKFKDYFDFINYMKSKLNPIDFKEVSKEDVTDELLRAIEETKNLDHSELVDY